MDDNKLENYLSSDSFKIQYIENALSYEAYYSLRESVGWNNFSTVQTMEALKNTCYSLLALHDNASVGMARVVGDGLYNLIVDVIVIPDFQRRGIGKTMMKMLLEYIENQTPKGGRASIQLISEKGKERFYEKLGFKQIPHEFCGSGMRKVINK